MLINSTTLTALRTGYSTLFQEAQAAMKAQSQWAKVATYLPSSDKRETYGWLKDDLVMRKWIGPRLIKAITENAQVVENQPFEMTIGVNRYDILFDKLGTYAPRFQNMGRAAEQYSDLLVWPLLKAGFNTNCWDGQFFFDTDHPMTNADGSAGTYANTDGGSGTPWFLIDTTKGMMPLVFQEAIKPNFVAKDNPDDERVFMNNEFVYGADAYGNAGYGLPQLAWGSKQTLDDTHYAAARAGLGAMKGDAGQPLGITPNLLVVPPSLEQVGRQILVNQNKASGASNEWQGSAQLLVVPWLA